MSAEEAPALDRAALLAAFAEDGAEFVLVGGAGGVAGQGYGASRVTKDWGSYPIGERFGGDAAPGRRRPGAVHALRRAEQQAGRPVADPC